MAKCTLMEEILLLGLKDKDVYFFFTIRLLFFLNIFILKFLGLHFFLE